MPYAILIFTFFLCTTAHAQYGDAYHRANQEQINKQQKAYTDAYIDALRYNRNTSAKSSGSADTKAAQELADLFAARAGRETSTQKAARLQKEQQDYQTYLQKKAVADKASADYFKDDRERRNLILEPLYAMYKEAGFPHYEAEYLSYSHLGDVLTADKQKHIYTYKLNEQSYRARESFIEFNKKLPTAGFDELFYLISDFNIASYSALIAMEKLEQRFPGKKEVLDAVGLLNTANFWGNGTEGGGVQYASAGKQVQEKMLNSFAQWFVKYPEGAVQVTLKADPYYNPLKLLARQADEKKDYEMSGRIAVLSLLQPKTWSKDPVRSKEYIHSFAGTLGRAKNKNADLFNTDDIKKIAANHEVPLHNVVEWLCSNETDKTVTASKYGWEYLQPFTKSYWEYEYDEVMKTLGLAGDGNALNIYAIAVAFGKQKEKPKMAIEYWAQAANAGSTWAMYNLLAASGWGFKWYKSADFATAKELWKTFKPATDYDKEVLNRKKHDITQLLTYNR
jgi:hypothetical protein